MKRLLYGFLIGLGTGAGGYWYFQQDAGKARLEQAKAQVVTNAQRAASVIKEKIHELTAEDIKDELSRSGTVVREKAKAAGESIAGAAANARTTASVKARLIAEPGLSAFSINVDTTDGLVTLSGRVESHDQIAKAVKLALETDGVHKVVSTLQTAGAGR